MLVTRDSYDKESDSRVGSFEQTDENNRRDGVRLIHNCLPAECQKRLSAGRNVVSKHAVAARDWLPSARGMTWSQGANIDVCACASK